MFVSKLKLENESFSSKLVRNTKKATVLRTLTKALRLDRLPDVRDLFGAHLERITLVTSCNLNKYQLDKKPSSQPYELAGAQNALKALINGKHLAFGDHILSEPDMQFCAKVARTRRIATDFYPVVLNYLGEHADKFIDLLPKSHDTIISEDSAVSLEAAFGYHTFNPDNLVGLSDAIPRLVDGPLDAIYQIRQAELVRRWKHIEGSRDLTISYAADSMLGLLGLLQHAFAGLHHVN